MKKIIWHFLGLSIACGLAPVVIAHPGHGQNSGSFSIFHYLTESVHFGVGIALIAVGVVGVYWFERNISRTNKAKKS